MNHLTQLLKGLGTPRETERRQPQLEYTPGQPHAILHSPSGDIPVNVVKVGARNFHLQFADRDNSPVIKMPLSSAAA